MSVGSWLQVVGLFFELLGLGTVMLGISEARRAFTSRPSLVGRVRSVVGRSIRKIFRRGKVVEIQGAGTVNIAARLSGRGRVLTDWERLSPEERFKRLQEAVDRHDDLLADLDDKIEKEQAEREGQGRRERAEREALRQTLEGRISEAAAGGLTLQTWGALAFAVGILLSMAGVILG
jgi:hypothetical protein